MSRHQMSGRHRGFSLVELLVAIAVVGVLLAIAMPAVQSAREVSRSAQCRNHLRQVGIALQNHHSQFGHLPQDGLNGYGFAVFLLPHLDQAVLFDRIDPMRTTRSVQPGTCDVVLDVLRCPSLSASDHLQYSGAARGSYVGNGELLDQRMELQHVVDGESGTIAAGETVSEHAWAIPGTGRCDHPPNSGGRFSSPHGSGAHFVLCDASVRFLSDSIDAGTFRALGTPSGNDVPGDF